MKTDLEELLFLLRLNVMNGKIQQYLLNPKLKKNDLKGVFNNGTQFEKKSFDFRKYK